MKKLPNSRNNLDRGILRYAQSDIRAVALRTELAHVQPDFAMTRAICQKLFAYRKCQPWPATVLKNEGWATVYEAQKGDLPVLPTVDEAVAWANDLIARIDAAREGD